MALTLCKTLAFKSVFGYYFQPPGYSVAPQARKLVYEKNPFLKIVGFTDLDLNQNYFKIFLETVDEKNSNCDFKIIWPCCDVLFLVLADQPNEG